VILYFIIRVYYWTHQNVLVKIPGYLNHSNEAILLSGHYDTGFIFFLFYNFHSFFILLGRTMIQALLEFNTSSNDLANDHRKAMIYMYDNNAEKWD